MRSQLRCRLSFELDGQEQSLVLGDDPVVIGRSPSCDLVIPHESVSRTHVRVTGGDGGWQVADLGSKNGLRVNTFKVEQQALKNGDRIDLGAIRIYVDISPAGKSAEARVVWDEQQDRGLRTEVIDMDRLQSMLGPSAEPPVGRDLTESGPQPEQGESGPLSEPAHLGALFSQAAEALISCDSLDETLKRILALVFSNLPAERGVICLYDEATSETEPKVMRTRDGVPEEPIRISSNIANDVIQNRQALLVQDTASDERYGNADSIISMRITSAMCAPLYRDGHVGGFIYVDQQSGKHPLKTHDLQMLSTLAVLSAVAVEQAALRDGLRQEQEMRSKLARYSSPAVVDRIVRAPAGTHMGMVADEGDVTVLFADITGFTSTAETMRPAEVVRMLNQVFESLTEVVFEHEGTLDKFRGDGMMAFFGAPLAQSDHARRAVACALRMQEVLQSQEVCDGEGRVLTMRIGINSGPVIVGDIGSPQRKDYTVIGDVVNTASRLESSVAKPGEVAIGPTTFEQVKDDFDCEPLEEVQLKGKSQLVRPYRALRAKADA
ncbi:MAG: FHA domain-containing protein, partial [Proteobacteria bacterium]|nr:FHA domain-containing protein [Pseudomonadota bacterium]